MIYDELFLSMIIAILNTWLGMHDAHDEYKSRNLLYRQPPTYCQARVKNTDFAPPRIAPTTIMRSVQDQGAESENFDRVKNVIIY